MESRVKDWERLEALLRKAGKTGVTSLNDSELHELVRLYPAVAVDVARARMYGLDERTQRRINQLAIAAHGLLYRRPGRRSFAAVGRFLSTDYPRLFRRLWPYVATAVTIFVIGLLGAFVAARLRPAAVHAFVPGVVDLPQTSPGITVDDIRERFRRMPNAPLATGVMTNNVRVAFNAFALGITAGVGTCFILLVNALMLGGMMALFTNYGLGGEFILCIMPHGILEIMAVLIASAAGLRLGLSLAIPGRLTRGASLRAGGREALLLVLGTIPMFIVAGTIEGFVTPSYLPDVVKAAVGAVAATMAVLYLLLAGRRGRPAAEAG
jgi:uncharacterized membrane protein SpoIIM required for sporulation